MAEELEIKLTVAADAVPTILDWLNCQASNALEIRPLRNCYYDTPDADLNHEKAALRVRQSGSQYIQTLKTRGDFVDGAHRRNEWEWPIPGPSLNLGLLADTPLSDRINLARLQPVFETNFERHQALLDAHGTIVECAVDCGAVVAGNRQWPLNEVEFELKAGDAAALLELARQLADQVPLFLNLVSKAEQGYFLAGLYEPETNMIETGLVTCWLQALSDDWLTSEISHRLIQYTQQLRALAESQQLESQWLWLGKALKKGIPVAELAQDKRLIQLQLDLLKNGQ